MGFIAGDNLNVNSVLLSCALDPGAQNASTTPLSLSPLLGGKDLLLCLPGRLSFSDCTHTSFNYYFGEIFESGGGVAQESKPAGRWTWMPLICLPAAIFHGCLDLGL